MYRTLSFLFSNMRKFFISEYTHLKELTKSLDKKVSLVFIISIILLTFSWYFSNPQFFQTSLSKYFVNDNDDIKLLSFTYWFLSDFILLLLIPVLFIKFYFKELLEDYGLCLGKLKQGFNYTLISIILFIPIVLVITNSNTFKQYFPLIQLEGINLSQFLIYEILFILFIYSWEFIFRGFMLFGLERRFGIYSIYIQMVPFVILHNGKPFVETFMSIFGGIILGFIAIRTRSIFYGFLIHAFILVVLDLIAFIGN